MKKTKKLRKYATGTSIKNYLKDPYTELQKYRADSAEAKYEAESNPWTMGMKALGNLAMNYGISQGGFSKINNRDGELSEFSQVAGDEANAFLPIIDGLLSFAYGGKVPVEIEGGEVGETPAGQVFEAVGPSHEQGGIEVALPELTEMFSKRISVDGVTIADRKKKREKRENRLENMSEKRETDNLLKNTLARTKKNNLKEEDFDTTLQELVTMLLDDNTKKANNLENINEKQQFQGGGTIYGPLIQYLNSEIPNFGGLTGTSEDFHSTPPSISLPGVLNGVNTPETMGDAAVPFLEPKTFNPNSILPVDYGQLGNEEEAGNPFFATLRDNLAQAFSGETDLTLGDGVGLLGNAASMLLPYINTLRSRAQSIPNENVYEGFGDNALATIEDASQYIEQVRDDQLGDLELSRNAAFRRNRNSARGINTLRALDLATDQGANRAESSIYNTFTQAMMDNMMRQASLETTQDQVIMRGEDERRVRDQQDLDNYFTNLAQNYVGIGSGLQETGADLNQIKQRRVIMNLLNQLSKYGIMVDDEGQLTTNK